MLSAVAMAIINARHSFVSWNLMLGKNLLWLAKQNGHSVQTMLEVYGTWTEGSEQADLDAIRRAMVASPRRTLTSVLRDPTRPRESQNLAVGPRLQRITRCMRTELYGGKGGTRLHANSLYFIGNRNAIRSELPRIVTPDPASAIEDAAAVCHQNHRRVGGHVAAIGQPSADAVAVGPCWLGRRRIDFIAECVSPSQAVYGLEEETMMRYSLVLTLSLAALAGCATQKNIHLPDGRKGYSINCSGSALTWENCYQKAGEICTSNGYEIVAKEGDQGATMSGTQYGVFAGSVITRVLLVACK